MDGQYEDSRKYLEEALELARAYQPESSLEARILYGLGDVHWRLGNFDQLRAYCEQSASLAQRLGDINTELYALNRLGTLVYLENADQAGSYFQQVYDKAMMHGDRERSAHALNNLGNVFMKKGDLASAKSYIEKALALMEEMGLQQHSSAGWMLDSLIDISLKLGDLSAARGYTVKNLIFARRIGLLPLLLYTFLQAARIILTESELDEYGLALLGLVLNHPASDFDTRQALLAALVGLGVEISDPRVSPGIEKGKILDVDQTVNTLLIKFGES